VCFRQCSPHDLILHRSAIKKEKLSTPTLASLSRREKISAHCHSRMLYPGNLNQLFEVLTAGKISNTHPPIISSRNIKRHPVALSINHPRPGTGEGMQPYLMIYVSCLGSFTAQKLPTRWEIIEEITNLNRRAGRTPGS
jgi:hypothetical protein